MKSRVMLLCVSNLWMLPIAANAQVTIHVPADASTIQAGIDAAQNGDTVLVAPGSYNENIDFKGKGITVTSGAQAFSYPLPIINGVQNGAVATFGSGESQAAVLNGFVLQGGHTSVGVNVSGGGILVDGSAPTITNNIVTNNIGFGILIVNGASPWIQGNDIKQSHFVNDSSRPCSAPSGIGGVQGTGVAMNSAGSPSLIGNVIEENALSTEGGVESEGAGISMELTHSVMIQGNTIRNNTAAAYGAIGGLIGNMAGNLVLVQNLIYGNSGPSQQIFISGSNSNLHPTLSEINNTIIGAGEELVYSFGSSTIANKIIFNPASSPHNESEYGQLTCADPPALSSPIDIRNNDLYTSGGNNTALPCTLGAGNLSIDPLLPKNSANDFHEQPSSPTVAVGDPTVANLPAADLDGKARTVCGTVDMGAYEVHPRPTLTITASINPSVGGTPVTFTTAIAGNCNVPTGTVTFYDGSAAIGTATLTGGAAASLTTAALTVGSHNITVQYPGDFNFDAGTSPTLVQVVTGYPTGTTLSISPNPAGALAPITLTASVSSAFGQPGGTVVFTTGGTTLGSATLNASGQATVTLSSLGTGTYPVLAMYLATTTYAASSSATLTETVIGAESVTALSASPNPAFAGQPVTLSAAVRAAQGSAIPKGIVTFSDGGTPLGTVSLSAAGGASYITSSLSPGSHAISATYSGDANFNPTALL